MGYRGRRCCCSLRVGNINFETGDVGSLQMLSEGVKTHSQATKASNFTMNFAKSSIQGFSGQSNELVKHHMPAVGHATRMHCNACAPNHQACGIVQAVTVPGCNFGDQKRGPCAVGAMQLTQQEASVTVDLVWGISIYTVMQISVYCHAYLFRFLFHLGMPPKSDVWVKF